MRMGTVSPGWALLLGLLFWNCLLSQSKSALSASAFKNNRKPPVADISYAECKRLQQGYYDCLAGTLPDDVRRGNPGAPNSGRRTTFCTIKNLPLMKRCNYCVQDYTFCTPDQYRYSSSLQELVDQVDHLGPLGKLHGQAATLAYTLPNRVAKFIGKVTDTTPVMTYYYIPPNNGVLGSCEQLPDNASPEELAELNGNGTSGKQCAFMRCEMGDNLATLGNVSGYLLGLDFGLF